MTHGIESQQTWDASEQTHPDVLAIDLRIAIMRTSRRLRTEASGDVVSPGQYAALTHLQEGSRTLRELAQLENVQAPSMNRIINALTGQGLVTRESHPDDGRQILLSITPAGEKVINEARSHRTAWLARRVAGLCREDRQTLSRAAHLMLKMSAS